MLEKSTDLLYIALAICALGFTAFLCYLLLALTKVVQESKKTVEDINKKLEKINPIVDTSTTTITSLMETVQTINDNILKPVASLSKMFKGWRQAASIFRGKDK